MLHFVWALGCTEQPRINVNDALPVLAEQLAAHQLQAEWVDAPLVPGVGPAYQVRAGNTRVYIESDRLVATDLRAQSPQWSVGLALTRWGTPDDLAPVAPGITGAAGARAEIRRPGIIEWVEGTARGPEHGFTILNPPIGDELVLELSVTGGRPLAMNDRIRIRTRGGAIDWAELVVWDDTRRRLPASFEVEGPFVRVRADVRGAQYPVTVDPLLLLTEGPRTLSGVPTPEPSFLGAGLALDDGRILISDPGAPGGPDSGIAVLMRPEADGAFEWVFQEPGIAGFGSAVALHGDVAVITGSTPAIGVFVYAHDTQTWERIESPELGCLDCEGLQIDLSDDLLVVGMPEQEYGIIQAWERDASGTGFTEIPMPLATGAKGDRFGDAVATFGPYIAATATGSARVRLWKRDGPTIEVLTDLAGAAGFGTGLDLAGNRLAVGAPADNRVYLYKLAGATVTPVATLEAPPAAQEGFGTRVAFAGPTLAVLDSPPSGEAQVHLYELSATQWEWREAYAIGPAGPHAPTLDLSNDWVVAGFPDAAQYSVSSRSGDTLKLLQRLTEPNTVPTTGAAVVVDGNTIAIGSYQPDLSVCPGVAVFERDETLPETYDLKQVLTACSDTSPDYEDGLGNSLALAEHQLLVAGNPYHGHASDGRALVWTYENGYYGNPESLYSPDAFFDTEFGSSVATNGRSVIVGQMNDYDDPAIELLPRGYIFHRDEDGTWVPTVNLSDGTDEEVKRGLGDEVGLGDSLAALAGAPPIGQEHAYGSVELYTKEGVPLFTVQGTGHDGQWGSELSMDGERVAFTAPGAGANGEVHIYGLGRVGVPYESVIMPVPAELLNFQGLSMDGQRLLTWGTNTRLFQNLHGFEWTLLVERPGTARGGNGRVVVVTEPDGALAAYELVAANLPPTARDDNYLVPPDPGILGFTTVLVNDSDPNFDPIVLELVADPTPPPRTFELRPDGTFLLALPFEGPAPPEITFTYRLSDGQLTSKDATVTVQFEAEAPFTPTEPPPREIRLAPACTTGPIGPGAGTAWFGSVVLLASISVYRLRRGRSVRLGSATSWR